MFQKTMRNNIRMSIYGDDLSWNQARSSDLTLPSNSMTVLGWPHCEASHLQSNEEKTRGHCDIGTV